MIKADVRADAFMLVLWQFCGMVPDGLAGLRNSSNKDVLKAASTSCGSRRSEERARPGANSDGSSSQTLAAARKNGMRRWDERERVLARANGTQGGEAGALGLGARRELLQYSGREGPCVWHDMCDQSVMDRILGVAGMFCTSAGCVSCPL